MLKVKILKPVGGYEIGDTPEITGNRFRELEASGHVERYVEDGKAAPAKPKGKRR